MKLRLLFALAFVAGCSGGLEEDDAPLDPISHTFPSITLAPGEERTSDCQSWTVGNDEPLYVQSVSMSADAGWHHSNWMFVPESSFDGPDGTWDCDARDYDEVVAGLSGGVLFAQSTQVTSEQQAFPEGAALIVPERARILARVHVLNASASPLDTAISLTLQPLRENQVIHRLRPLVGSYFPLEIRPQSRSLFRTRCAVGEENGGTLDYSLYYLLPHYHALGTGMYVTAFRGSAEQIVFDGNETIGEPLGQTYSPPLDLNGVTELEFGCRYDNPTDEWVYFENDDGGEMCMTLAYTDDGGRWLMGTNGVPNVVVGTDGEGVVINEAECTAARL